MYFKDKKKVVCVRLTEEQFKYLENIEKENYTKKSVYIRNLIELDMLGVKSMEKIRKEK